MLGDSKQASSVTTSLIYITIGSLIDVWAIVSLFYLRSTGGSQLAYLCVYGFIFTGIALFLIGLAVGKIGQSTRPAEVSPVPTQQIVTPTAGVGVTPATVAPENPVPVYSHENSAPATIAPQVSPVSPAGNYAVSEEALRAGHR